MNDAYIEQSGAELSVELAPVSVQAVEARNESDSYQVLLNTADAARDGLAWGEHDYDIVEEGVV